MGTCSNPARCDMPEWERLEEERFAARQRQDALFAGARLLCPNCLGQGERSELTHADGLFTCPECGAACDAEELLEVYEYVKNEHIAADPCIDASIATLARGRAA